MWCSQAITSQIRESVDPQINATRNEKCGKMVIGQQVWPRDRRFSTVYHTQRVDCAVVNCVMRMWKATLCAVCIGIDVVVICCLYNNLLRCQLIKYNLLMKPNLLVWVMLLSVTKVSTSYMCVEGKSSNRSNDIAHVGLHRPMHYKLSAIAIDGSLQFYL